MLRPRSHSSDSPTPQVYLAGASWQTSSKRGQSSTPSSGQWDLDSSRRKRRRRDTSVSYAGDLVSKPIPTSLQQSSITRSPPQRASPWLVDQQASGQTAHHEPRLATSSAQFNFFPTSTNESRRSQLSESWSPGHYGEQRHVNDLIRLRSTAFWELRQSVAENGEGMVRRMRDYERSRSRYQAHQKAKEAEKRGRKRLPLRARPKPSVSDDASDSSDDEDVLICSDDTSNSIPHGPLSTLRARSFESMDVDLYSTTQQRSPPSSPITQYTPASMSYHSEEEDRSLHAPHTTIAEFEEVGSSPSLSHSPCQSDASSSVLSLALHSPNDLDSTTAALPANASEKAIAALNLALANGAGSISDYSSIWAYEQRYNAESYDSGDLWQ